MAWTPRRTAAAVVLATGVVNAGIIYWLFRDNRLLLFGGAAIVVLGSVGSYRSLSRSLTERAAEREE
jgi:hypothetical protein